MNSEKVKEIKKVLECCSILTNKDLPMETRDDACHDCPYGAIERCTPLLVKNSLTLINELESENERLLKVIEEDKFTFNTTQGTKYSVFDTVRTITRKETAEKIYKEYLCDILSLEAKEEFAKEFAVEVEE